MILIVAGRELVDGAELARRLAVSRTTVWRLAKLGRIPYFEIGRRWYFAEPEVLDALRARPANDVAADSRPCEATSLRHRRHTAG
jgi:excisionase family DNA binding protein